MRYLFYQSIEEQLNEGYISASDVIDIYQKIYDKEEYDKWYPEDKEVKKILDYEQLCLQICSE